jgi:glycosyltransferase involved in cell wall biosynthesis
MPSATLTKPSLSVVLITHNAAKRLAPTLEAVSWADDILIVDSGSTDGTRELAERLGAKVILQPDWQGFGYQKNFALARASGDWILVLDADEVVDPQLATAIQRVLRSGEEGTAGYALERVNYFGGVRLRFGLWRPVFLPRLFRKGRGRVSDDVVHERVIIDGPTARLEGSLHHFTSETIADRIRKNDEYSSIIARVQHQAGRRVSLMELLLIMPAVLFRDLVLRLGLLDGRAGIIVAVTGAFYDFSKYAKIWELERRAAAGETVAVREPTTPPAARGVKQEAPTPSVAGKDRG